MTTPANTSAPVAKTTRVDTTSPTTFTLANLARELKINPKIARQRARKNAAKMKPYLATSEAHSHVYHVKHRDAIKAIISPRPKPAS